MKTETCLITFLAGSMLLGGCLKEEPLDRPYTGSVPTVRPDGIVVSAPGEEGIDPAKLEEVFRASYSKEEFWSIRSLLVFRHGRLVAETYHKDPGDIDEPHLIWSCTKQVLAILTGMALERGFIRNLDDPMGDYLPSVNSAHPDKSGITLKHLLTMYSGIDYENDGPFGETDKVLRQQPDDITRFILSRPLREAPGTTPHYNDGDPQLMAKILQDRLDQPLDEWAEEVLLAPAGVSNLIWNRYRDGTTLGGFGIETTPRELGKIALVVANRGIIGEDTLVSPGWIDTMLAPKLGGYYIYGFGYYWWSDPELRVYFMNGHGGQYAFISSEKEVVVVITAIPNTQGNFQLLTSDALTLVEGVMQACD